MIILTNIVHYPLDIPHLCIFPGYTAIIGPNGSGKTTLLRIFAGLLSPSRGDVTIDGVTDGVDSVGWVDENPDRNILFSQVYDEISSALRFSFVPSEEITKSVLHISRIFGIEHLLSRKMEDLSGGEKIVVALAAAAIKKPGILVLDEPDAHLGMLWHTLMNHIKEIHPVYCICATHQMEIAAEADQVLYLEDGRVMHQGTPREVFFNLEKTCYYPVLWRMKHGCFSV